MSESDRIPRQSRQSQMSETFERWWQRDGRYFDPDTSDVPRYDKRKELAKYAWHRAIESRKEPVKEQSKLREDGRMKFTDARYVIVANGEGAQACVLAPDENIHESVHRFMCVCDHDWRDCDSQCTEDIRLIDDPEQWSQDESGKPFSVSWPHETGTLTLYRLSDPTPIPESA